MMDSKYAIDSEAVQGPEEPDYVKDYIKMYGCRPPPGYVPDTSVPHDFDFVRMNKEDDESYGKRENVYDQFKAVKKEKPAKPKKFQGRALAASLILIVVMVLLFVSLITPYWYCIECSNTCNESGMIIESDWESNYGLRACMNTWKMETSFTSPDMRYLDDSYESDSKLELEEEENEGMVVFFIIIFTMIALMIMLVFGFLTAFKKIPGIIPVIMGFSVCILLLFAAVYFPVTFPKEVEKDSEIIEDAGKGLSSVPGMGDVWAKITDGFFTDGKLGFSYFLMVFSLIILTASSIMFIGTGKKKIQSMYNISIDPEQQRQFYNYSIKNPAGVPPSMMGRGPGNG